MKSKKEELLDRLRPQINNPDIGDVILLLHEYVEEFKETLIDAKGDDRIELQGAIHKIRGVLIDLKRNINFKPFKNGAYVGE